MALSFGPSTTSDANAVTVLTVSDDDVSRVDHFHILNDGARDGFFSIDGGVNFRGMPAGSSFVFDGVKGQVGTIQIKRAGAQDLSDVHGGIW